MSSCWQPKPEGLLPQEQIVQVGTTQNQTLVQRNSSEPDFTSGSLYHRVGFGLTASVDPLAWGQQLYAGWFIDWNIQFRRTSQSPEHWQMIRLSTGCIFPPQDFLSWMVLHYPGQVWIIGNEPDVIWQDSLNPGEYARLYHDTYQLIKTTDPTAIVATAGISQATSLRLAYLDRVLAAYQSAYKEAMPVDWWTVHGYVLREERGSWGVDIPPGFSVNQGALYEISDHARVDLFEQQIISFRQWMARNGYRTVPLALTEFGILLPAEYGFSPQIVQQYLKDTFQWLSSAVDADTGLPQDNNRLVQRWAWFSLADSKYPVSNLADLHGNHLTPAGEAFREFMLENSR